MAKRNYRKQYTNARSNRHAFNLAMREDVIGLVRDGELFLVRDSEKAIRETLEITLYKVSHLSEYSVICDLVEAVPFHAWMARWAPEKGAVRTFKYEGEKKVVRARNRSCSRKGLTHFRAGLAHERNVDRLTRKMRMELDRAAEIAMSTSDTEMLNLLVDSCNDAGVANEFILSAKGQTLAGFEAQGGDEHLNKAIQDRFDNLDDSEGSPYTLGHMLRDLAAKRDSLEIARDIIARGDDEASKEGHRIQAVSFYLRDMGVWDRDGFEAVRHLASQGLTYDPKASLEDSLEYRTLVREETARFRQRNKLARELAAKARYEAYMAAQLADRQAEEQARQDKVKLSGKDILTDDDWAKLTLVAFRKDGSDPEAEAMLEGIVGDTSKKVEAIGGLLQAVMGATGWDRSEERNQGYRDVAREAIKDMRSMRRQLDLMEARRKANVAGFLTKLSDLHETVQGELGLEVTEPVQPVKVVMDVPKRREAVAVEPTDEEAILAWLLSDDDTDLDFMQGDLF